MKKFVSALSALVLASTAMGGTALSASAAFADKIGGTVDSTIFDIQSNGSNAVTAKAGDKIPVEIYIPQCNGLTTISMKLSINGDETLGQGIEEYPDGTKKAHPLSYGNYGIKIVLPDPTDTGSAYPYPYCFDSGFIRGNYKNADKVAGKVSNAGVNILTADAYNILYVANNAANQYKGGSTNIDSYDAWVSAGKPDYANYTPVTEWTEKEFSSWSQQSPFLTFELELPADLADGTYVLDKVDKYVPYSALFDAEPAYNNSVVRGFNTVDPDFKTDPEVRSFKMKPLTITVGEAGNNSTTTTTATTTSGTTTTTTGTTPAPNPGNTGVDKPTPAKGTVVYDFVPADKDYYFDGTNNVVNVKGGESFTVEWKVSNDPGTAGMQYSLDFSAVTLDATDIGFAYDVSPEVNEDDPANIQYVFAKSEEMIGDENEAVMTFDITAPTKDGTYIVGANGKRAMTVPKNQELELEKTIYNLAIVVGETTTTASTTSTTASTTTTVTTTSTQAPDPGKTETKPAPAKGTVVYDFVPADMDYTFDGKNNVVKVKPGDSLTVEWKVSNDPGTAGMQYSLDFSAVTLDATDIGFAYDVSPEVNEDDPANIQYVFAKSEEMVGDENEALMTFEITAPTKNGTYIVGANGKRAMTVPKNQEEETPVIIYNLAIVVDDATATTTTTTTTTSGTTTTTTSTTTTTTTTSTTPKPGDVFWGDTNEDGKVSIADVVLLNKYLAKQCDLSDQAKLNADCAYDKTLDSKDSTAIKKYLAFLIEYKELGNQK